MRKQRIATMLAGSTRSGERLAKVGILDGPQCPRCGDSNESMEHVIWNCPEWHGQRAPYVRAIVKIIARVRDGDASNESRLTADNLKAMLSKTCLRRCGLVADDPYLHSSEAAPLEEDPHAYQEIPIFDELQDHHRVAVQVDSCGRHVFYTDGTADNPLDPVCRRAAWSSVVAVGHPWNGAGPVTTSDQTVFRAELAAVARTFAVVRHPTRVVVDCEAVVNAVQARIDGDDNAYAHNQDLWRAIDAAIASRPVGFFAVEWISSHLPIEHAQHIHDEGGFEARHIFGNHSADLAAKQAMTMHTHDRRSFREAAYRAAIAPLVQCMQMEVWQAWLQRCPHFAKAASEDQCQERLNEADNDAGNDCTNVGDYWPHPDHSLDLPPDYDHEEEDQDMFGGGFDAPYAPVICGDPVEPMRDSERQPQSQTAVAATFPETEDTQDPSARLRKAIAEAIITDERNRPLAHALKKAQPNYPWHNETVEEIEDLKFQGRELTPLTMEPKKQHKHAVLGTVRTTVDFPEHYALHVRKWLETVRWPKFRDEDRTNGIQEAEASMTHEHQATWLQAAVDFELFAGIKLRTKSGEDMDWEQRSRTLAAIVKVLTRTNVFTLAGRPTRPKRFLEPAAKANAFAPLGLPPTQGFAGMPRWADSRTNELAAINAIRAQEAATQATTAGAATKPFAKGWIVDFTGYPAKFATREETRERNDLWMRAKAIEVSRGKAPGSTPRGQGTPLPKPTDAAADFDTERCRTHEAKRRKTQSPAKPRSSNNEDQSAVMTDRPACRKGQRQEASRRRANDIRERNEREAKKARKDIAPHALTLHAIIRAHCLDGFAMSRHDQLALRRKVKGPQAEDDTVHVDDGLGCRLAALSTPDARVVNTIMRTHAGTRATARPDADYQGNFEAAIVVAFHPQPSQAAEVADHLAALVVANHGARRELEAGSFELSVANAERGGEDHSGQDRAKRRCLGGFTRKQKADSAPICFYDDDNGCRGLATTTCTDTDQHYVDDHHPLTMIPIDRSKMARQTQGISVDASLRPPQLGRKGAAVGHCNGSFLNQSAG